MTLSQIKVSIHSPENKEWLQKAKETLWQYEIKSELIISDVLDSLGILQNVSKTLRDPSRVAIIKKELKRNLDSVECVKEILEDMVIEVIHRYRDRQQNRMLTRRAEHVRRLTDTVDLRPVHRYGENNGSPARGFGIEGQDAR